MAYDEHLAERVRILTASDRHVTEKAMFGGLAFLYKGLMFVGISGSSLMARIGKDGHDDAMARKHVREMDFTGRPMRGYVYVDPAGLKTDAQLQDWVERCRMHVSTLPPKKKR